jgi:hypothetical protein
VKIPDGIRAELEEKVWTEADRLGWSRLSAIEKSQWYENWTLSEEVGGRLRRYGDANQIRLYLKDALMKRYARSRREGAELVLKKLGLEGVSVAKPFIKPHGCLLADKRVICWGRARTWKLVLMSVFERARWETGGRAFAVLLTQATAMPDSDSRKLVEDAANRLGIERVLWMSE